MAKIYEDKQIFKWQPSVFEMADHVVLGGQVHEKSTLAPVPFTTLSINSYSKNNLIGRNSWSRDTEGPRMLIGNASWLGGADEDHISFALDNSDSSIGYVFAPRDDAQSMWAHKINMNTFELLASAESDLGGSADRYAGYYDYPGQAYVIDQDNDYLYVMHKHRDTRRQADNSTYYYVGEPDIAWYSKTTMSKAGEYAPEAFLCNSSYIGKVGTTHFYCFHEGYIDTSYIDARNTIQVYKFDTASKVGASVQTMTPGTTYCSMGVASRPFDQGSDVMYSYSTTRSDASEEGYNIYKIETDMQGETATISGCTYNWGSYTRADEITRHNVNDRHHVVTTFTTDDGSNQYVSFVVCETPGQWDITLDAFKVHTFLIGGADGSHLTYKGNVNPGFRIRGIMHLEDDFTKFILFGDSHSEIYTWNDQTETYVETSTVNIQCYAAMTDSLNRLWMTDESNNVHLLSSFSPLTITVIPELNDYNYAGSVINTYINVSAYDIDNSRLATNVKLVLEGATYFTDDTQVKTITTSASAETQVNIKITGTSFTRILASVVV